jgi:hypothetical protein
MLLPFLRGKIIPAAFFELFRIVKLRTQINAASQATSKKGPRAIKEGTNASLRGLTKQKDNARIRDFFWLGFIRRVCLCQHGLSRSVLRSVCLVAGRCVC